MGELDYGALRLGLQFVQIAAVVVLGIYTWIQTGRKANRQAIDAVASEVAQNRRRVDIIETQLEHTPSHTDLGQIYERINALSGELQRLNGQATAINHQLGLISEHLINREKP